MALTIVNRTRDDSVVCARTEVADNVFKRLRGLLGRASLASGDGMLFRGESSIHSAFMRFRFDAVFMDRELRVVGLAERHPAVAGALVTRGLVTSLNWRPEKLHVQESRWATSSPRLRNAMSIRTTRKQR